MLDVHKKMHKELLKCPHCDYTAAQRSWLRQHVIAVHNKEQKYLCDICAKAFCYESVLKRHIEGRYLINQGSCVLIKILLALLIQWAGLAEACGWVEWFGVDIYDPKCFVLSYYTPISFSRLCNIFKHKTDIIWLNKVECETIVGTVVGGVFHPISQLARFSPPNMSFILNVFRSSLRGEAVNYRPFATPSFEVASHVKYCHIGHYYYDSVFGLRST